MDLPLSRLILDFEMKREIPMDKNITNKDLIKVLEDMRDNIAESGTITEMALVKGISAISAMEEKEDIQAIKEENAFLKGQLSVYQSFLT